MLDVEVLQRLFDVLTPEVLLAVGGFMFNLLVLPTLLDPDAGVPRVQSALSAVALLFCFTVPYAVLGFYWSALANSIGVILWSIVAVYRTPSRSDSESSSSDAVQSSGVSAD